MVVEERSVFRNMERKFQCGRYVCLVLCEAGFHCVLQAALELEVILLCGLQSTGITGVHSHIWRLMCIECKPVQVGALSVCIGIWVWIIRNSESGTINNLALEQITLHRCDIWSGD